MTTSCFFEMVVSDCGMNTAHYEHCNGASTLGESHNNCSHRSESPGLGRDG